MRKLDIIKILLVLLFVSIVIVILYMVSSSNLRDDIFPTWKVDKAIKEGLRRYPSDIKVKDKDKKYLLDAARTVLENHFSEEAKLMSINDFHNVPSGISSQSARVYITLIAGGGIRGCQSAKNGNLLENTIEAMYRAIDDERFGGPLRKEELSKTIIDITLLLDPIAVKSHKIKQIKQEIEVGIHAFSLEKGGKKAFFKSSVPISHGYSLKEALKKLGKKAKIGNQAYRDPETKIYKYTAIQFAENPQDTSLVNFFRNNRLVYQSDVTRESQLKALKLCGNYMVNHIDNKGRITYNYNVYKNKKECPDSSASVIRSLASIWILASMGNYFNNDEYKEAAKCSVNYFLSKYYVYDQQRDFGYIQVGEDANLAMASFMLLSLLEMDDQQHHAGKKQKLINFILAMEDKKKGFLYPVYLPDRRRNFERKEVYYPGEALTAIMTLYESTHDRKYLAVAERVFDYYKELFVSSPKRANMVPWMSKAYTKVFFATGERKYSDFVLQMNDYILKYQKDIDEKYVDKIGSFFSKGASYSAGVFAEGIAEGYRVAVALNDKKRMRAYRKSVLMAIRFLLQCQYTEDNMFTAKDARLTLGGIRTTVYTSSIRIDSLQHATCALLKALEYIY